MRQILGIWGGMGNSQSAPVRSYVLYFERLAGWAKEGQGAVAGPVRGNGTGGWTTGVSQDETGIVPCPGTAGAQRAKSGSSGPATLFLFFPS